MNMLPAPSNTSLDGRSNSALVAAKPSPTPIARPLPAIGIMLPGTKTARPPEPVPVRYAVPSTLLLGSRRTTAPARTPGYAGVKVTGCEQVELTPITADVQAPPLPTTYSRFGAPSVR